MSGRENNKIVAAILVAGLIAMLTGKIVDSLYKPNLHPKERGFEVAVSDTATPSSTAAPEEKEINIDIKTLMQTASADAGKALLVKCAACHNTEKGGPNRVGPNLWDIIDRVKATHDGYAYSNAMKALGGNWDYDSLAKFLHKPMQFVKGTKMSFAGFNKQQDVANIIAYLRTLSDSPKALP